MSHVPTWRYTRITIQRIGLLAKKQDEGETEIRVEYYFFFFFFFFHGLI